MAQLAKDQQWRPGQWAFDGRKNIYSPDQFLPKEERSYQVSFECSMTPRYSQAPGLRTCSATPYSEFESSKPGRSMPCTAGDVIGGRADLCRRFAVDDHILPLHSVCGMGTDRVTQSLYS